MNSYGKVSHGWQEWRISCKSQEAYERIAARLIAKGYEYARWRGGILNITFFFLRDDKRRVMVGYRTGGRDPGSKGNRRVRPTR